MEGEANKLSEHEFVIRAIKKLRKPPYKGIHSVYSGFNKAFKDYFNVNPVEATTRWIGGGMEPSEIARSLRELWDNKPGMMILLIVGAVGSLILIIDACRHRRRRKRPR